MPKDRYLSPGTKVKLDSLEGESEEGVVVHCWADDAIDAYDCFVAFYGLRSPKSAPEKKPYVLRYAASSLKVIEPSESAMMLRDTVVWMLDQQNVHSGDTDFEQGYRMGYSFALDTLKSQCETFGLADDLGWMQPDVEKWLKAPD